MANMHKITPSKITKKKSKLQKKLDNPNSGLWRKKADKLWKEIVHLIWNGKCAICQSTEWVQAHHQIPREMYSHRHTIKNGICLCAKHHRFSFELSAHKSPVAFYKWLGDTKPDILNWLLKQEPTRKNNVSFKDIAICLEGEKNALERQNETGSL